MKLIILILGLTANSYAQEPIKDLVNKLSQDIQVLSEEMIVNLISIAYKIAKFPLVWLWGNTLN